MAGRLVCNSPVDRIDFLVDLGAALQHFSNDSLPARARRSGHLSAKFVKDRRQQRPVLLNGFAIPDHSINVARRSMRAVEVLQKILLMPLETVAERAFAMF